MREAIRRLRDCRGKRGQHAGLLLQRYLCEPATGENGNPEEKRAILDAAIEACVQEEVRELYRIAFERWDRALPEGSERRDLATVGRLVIGLGSESVLETGIRLHHTLGAPILPGSALKGVSAHHCDRVWGASEEGFRRGGRYHRLLFGATDEGGQLVFHDAWFVPDPEVRPLKLDVMTPHHPGWLDGSIPPTDFDSPVPVPFLSVSGKFRVALSWRGDLDGKARDWTSLSMELLLEALRTRGVGGKTTSGYGRLEVPPPPPAPPPPKERKSGDRARVVIVGPRAKGGFDVRDVEPGRNPGTLTVGTPPAGLDLSPGMEIEVQIHNDAARRPQYRWPSAPKKTK